MRPALTALLMWAGVLTLGGAQANAAKSTPPASAPAPAWPAPPAEPYVVFRQLIRQPADIGVKAGPLKGLTRWLSGAADRRELVRPFGLALDETGRLLLTDTGANVVSRLDLARKQWLRWEQAGPVRFQSPVAVAGRGQTIYVADSALGKVIAFTEKGKLVLELSQNLARPAGLAIVGERLLVADSQLHQVASFSLRGEPLGVFGRRGGGAGEFNFPTHVAGDNAGRIYVTDAMNYRVQVFEGTGKFLRAIGSAGDSRGRFARPKGVAVDRFGHVYVVDALFDTIQVFDAEGRLLLNCGEGGAERGQFWLPNGIAVGPDDAIYVADSYNGRLQVLHYTGKP